MQHRLVEDVVGEGQREVGVGQTLQRPGEHQLARLEEIEKITVSAGQEVEAREVMRKCLDYGAWLSVGAQVDHTHSLLASLTVHQAQAEAQTAQKQH